jgi:acyl-CoA synthetase (AMP-forming)/AMP-acid ligase II
LTVALIEADTGRSVAHDELKTLGGRFASLINTGENKQLVLIAAWNRIGVVAALRGAWQAGHAVLLIDAALPAAHMQRWIRLYSPDKLILPEDHEFRPDENYVAAGSHESLVLYARSVPHQNLHPDLALLLPTSGSTGSPKLVRLSRQNLDANTAAIIAALGITSQDRAAAHMPLAYSYGLSVANTHLAAGASLVLTDDSLTEGAFWQAMRDHQITTLPCVPQHFAVIEKLGLERLDVPHLRIMTQAGGRMEPKSVCRFAAAMQKRGGRFFVMYGQTEAASRMTVLPAAHALDKPESAGLPLAQGKILIEDGEIIYHGPNVMMGYAENRADLARGDEVKGRLATGDLGYLDAEGYLFITGRKQRFAKIDGLRIDLDEIEIIAGAVAPTVVFEQDGQLMLFTTTTGDTEILRRHVAAHVHVHTSRLLAQKLAAFPLLANGKIDRQSLRKLSS